MAETFIMYGIFYLWFLNSSIIVNSITLSPSLGTQTGSNASLRLVASEYNSYYPISHTSGA